MSQELEKKMGAKVYSLAMDSGENPVSFAVLFAHFLSKKKKKIQEKDEQGCRNSNNCYFFLKALAMCQIMF